MRNGIFRFLFFYNFLLLTGVAAFAQIDVSRLSKELKIAKEDNRKVLVLDSMALYYRDANPDTALKFIRQGLELAQGIKYIYGEAKLRSVLSQLYGHWGNRDDAYKESLHALQLFRAVNSDTGIASAYNQLSVVEAKMGNYDSAMYYILESKKIFEKYHDTNDLVHTYINLGNIAEEDVHDDKALDKALQYFEIALTYAKDNKNSRLSVLNNIGIIYGKKGELEKSLTYFNTVLTETDTITNFDIVRINALINCVVAYDNLGDHAKAFKYLDEELKLARSRHMLEEEVIGLINLGAMQSNTDTAKGLQSLRDALALSIKVGNKSLQLKVYDNMVDVYTDHKDFKNAFLIQGLQYRLSSQVFNMEKAKQISSLQASYELEKSNIKVDQLKMINHKNETQKTLLLIFVCFITTALLIIIFFYRQTILLNSQLKVQKEELKQLNTIKDKLFSVIGHDLRSPVGSIVSLLSIWDTGSLSEEEKKEVIYHLKSQTRATLETLDKLLNWGQSQIKGITIFQTEFAPKRLIKDSLELLMEQALKKNITITDNTPPDIQVFADRLQFDFVIRNLLSNAIKFTHIGGAIEISTDNDAVKDFTVFKIKDNGIGINEGRHKTIFEAIGNSTDGTANEKGTNVGLKLCKEYVVTNGGQIWVESVEGQGAIFCFTIKNKAT